MEKGGIIASLRGITKGFSNGAQRTEVLNGIDLDVYENEFLVILGESGCGKSTLLNILGGMDSPSGGTFTFRGKDISNADEHFLTLYRRDNIGFVFQAYNLMPNMTAEQNLSFIAELCPDPLDTAEALAMVGLSDRAGFYPAQMSGGQQQRVSIARALVKKPRLILADEPTAALDHETSIEVLAVFEDVVRKGTTLVMVTHNAQIARMADRVVCLKGGVVDTITVNEHPAPAKELVW